MSLVINTTTPEGIVIAADSRQSYRNRKGISRIGSDTAKKLYKVNDRIGVAITGLAFIEINGTLNNVSSVIDEFIESNNVETMSVEDVANGLYAAFSKVYKVEEQFKLLESKVKLDLQQQGCKDIKLTRKSNLLQFSFKAQNGILQNGVANIEQINFLVAGYNADKSHEVYVSYLPGDIKKTRNSKEKGKEYGASWIGQTDLVSRIILGFDPRIGNLASIQKIGNSIGNELRNLEYSIQWGTMTLQDGVDFSDLMIKTTTAIQRFSDGIVAEPGDVPGVGGDVDIAVITKNNGFVWINKKSIIYNNTKIVID